MKPARIDASAEARGDAGKSAHGGEGAPFENPESVASILRAIAHELSQPLTACRGALELVLLKGKSISDYRKACEKAFAAAERMVTIVQTVRELAEVSAPPGKLVPVELGALTRRVVEDLTPIAELQGVTLGQEIAPRIVVMADEERFYEALLKIVHLAVLRSPRQRRVQVSLSADSDKARLSIQDEGTHFSPARNDDHSEIAGLVSSPGGGPADHHWALVVARKAIEACRGSFAAENVSPRGCRFHIRIPLVRKTSI